VQSIHRLLDDDEDMALMNLSRLLTHPERFVQPVPQRVLNEESDEPELILEANLQVGLTLVNYLEVMLGQIHTAKELIDQRLDATRNKLLFANMLISVFTLCVTLGALVGSFFGMNLILPNNLGEDDFAFNQVVAYTCIGCIVICIAIMMSLLYTDTISFRLSGPFRPVRIDV
jgi:magnesium transporter